MHKLIFESKQELLDAANVFRDDPYGDPKFTGVKNVAESIDLFTNGWDHNIDTTMQLVEDNIHYVMDTYDVPAWTTVMDVQGGAVDVGAFMTGEPECMQDSVPMRVSKLGRVVTIVLSLSVSAAVKKKEIEKRGQYYVALVTMLQRAGYGVDLWLDCTIECATDEKASMMYHAMEPGDVVDVQSLMFMLAHPAMLRGIVFAAWHKLGKQGLKLGIYYGLKKMGGPYGHPRDPCPEHYPEGALMTASVLTGESFDISVKLVEDLTALGIIA